MPSSEGQQDLLLKAVPARDRNPVARYLDGLAPGSRRTLKQALDRIAGLITRERACADTLAWHRLTRRHAAILRSTLLKTYSPATVNKMLSAFRGVLREACGLGYITESDLRRMASLPSARNDRLATGRTLGGREVRALFGACAHGGGAASCRDAALLALLYGAGMRRGEAVALELADYDPGSALLRLHGATYPSVNLRTGARAALEDWLHVRGRAVGALLCPVDKAGRVRIRHMTDQAVLYIVRRLAELAGIRRFSPHDLRRSFFLRMRRNERKGGRGAREPARRAQAVEKPLSTLPVPFQGCDQ